MCEEEDFLARIENSKETSSGMIFMFWVSCSTFESS